MTGETYSLCRTCTPMLTSPAFSPSVSLLGIDTKGDTIPRTNTTNPSQNKDFIDTPIYAVPSIVTTTLSGDS